MIYVLAFAAFVIAWLLPGHYFPWHSFQQEAVAAAGALLLGLAAVASPTVRRLPVPWVAVGAFALAAVPLAQWSFGKFPFVADAVLPSLYLSGFALTIVASAALARADGQRFVGALFGAILIAALASNGIALVQWLQIGPVAMMENLGGGRPYANLTQPNQFACLLGLALAAIAWLFETQRIGRVTSAVAIAFIGWGMVMTQSRAAAAIVGMYFAWWFVGRAQARLRCTGKDALGALGILTGLALAWGPINSALMGSSVATIAERVQSVGTRGIHWPALWDAATREPLTGWGWMQVGAAQRSTALDYPASGEWVTYSHNLLLDLWVWNGLLIGSLVIIGIVWWAASRCINCKDSTTWALLGAGGAIAAYSLVEFPHAYAFFLLPMAIFIGSIEGLRPQNNNRPGASLPKWLFCLPSLLAGGVVVVVVLDYLEVEEASRRTSLFEAGYVAGNQTPRPPEVILLDNQRDFVWFRLTEAREGMPAEDVERMRRINQRYMPPAVMLRYALAAGLNGRPADAEENLKLICKMWRPIHCDEGRQSWRELQLRYPRLASIPFPAQ